MNKTIFALILVFILVNNVGCSESNKSISKVSSLNWSEGGTLQQGYIHEWKNSEYRNKLSSAADIAASSPSIVAEVQESGSFDTLKPYAVEMVQCIDEVALDDENKNKYIPHVAADCSRLLGWY